MVDINEAKLEAGRRVGIEVNGVKENNLHFTSFAEWMPADGAILLLCTKTYDNPAGAGADSATAFACPHTEWLRSSA